MSRILLQHIRRILPMRRIALLLVVLAFAITTGFQAYAGVSKDITIAEGTKIITAKTLGNNIQQAMDQLEMRVGSYDYTSVPLTTSLIAGIQNTLSIQRAVPVTMQVDGSLLTRMTWRNNVQDFLEDEKVSLANLDRMEGATLETPLKAGLAFKIVRVRLEKMSELEPITYDVLEQVNKTLNEGETLVAQAGIDGQIEKNFRIVYEDEKPISRTFLDERIISEPVNRIVEFGTVKNFTNNRGDLVRFSKIMDMKATAYTASLADTGKAPGHPAFGITRTGIRAREGVIAVDPRIIPLGTKVYVEVPGAAADYGFAIAADIGSAIKGKLIDLYFDTTAQAMHWGRRSVRIYILNEQNDSRWKVNDEPCTK